MVVVGKKHINDFVAEHPECKQELSELVREFEASRFGTPLELKAKYPSGKILDGRIAVFKVRGNRYRLSIQVAYNTQIMVIIAMETHAQYDRRTLR
jgi:mRNA interferase HigB